MNFYNALKIATEEDGHITKDEWGDPQYWGQMLEGKLVLHKPDGVFYPWILSDGDLLGEDWSVLEYA